MSPQKIFHVHLGLLLSNRLVYNSKSKDQDLSNWTFIDAAIRAIYIQRCSMNPEKLTSSLILISLPGIFLGVLLPMYTHELGYTTFQYALIVSILSFSQIMMNLVLGRASDRHSRRFIFLSALIFFTTAYFVFSVATQLSILIVARVISGIAGILLSISLVGLISDSNNSFGQRFGY